MHDNETHLIQPDGYSYIIYKTEETSTVLYYKPSTAPLILKSERESIYYISKCRPTFVGYLMKQKIKMTPLKPTDFLKSLSSTKFKSIIPTVLDNIVMHLHANKNASLPELKKHYQCTHLKINYLFKKNIGVTFSEYKNILKQIT
ncbi:hypothetical protein [Formosa undariae]|uniref:hypothetical protein n=1 Tax=Formosa undariae TaxID=1325436 RepID=UPI0036D26756